MLEGLLVDLVPFGDQFLAKDHEWTNSIAQFWSSVGSRPIASKAQVETQQREWLASERPNPGVPFGVQDPPEFRQGRWIVSAFDDAVGDKAAAWVGFIDNRGGNRAKITSNHDIQPVGRMDKIAKQR